jgi:DNA-binding NarL/FixJ family response regulator
MKKFYRHSILELLAQGFNHGEIAKKNGTSTNSVTQTLYLMRRATGTRTTIELVVRYREGSIPASFAV